MSAFPFPGEPIGFQQISQDSVTAGRFTVPPEAKFVLITVETESVRFRADGTAPTVSIGWLLLDTASEPFIYSSPAGLSTLQFIAVTGTAVINAEFYG